MKKKVANLPDNFLRQLKTSGLTYEEMMQDYGLTRWGARKIGQHEDVDEEEAGNHEKLFALNRDDHNLGGLKVPVQEDEVQHEEQRRNTPATKQTITNKASKYLTKLEEEVKNTETRQTSYEQPEYEENGYTAIIHETDSHFSAYVKNRKGDVIYDTETAANQTKKAFSWYSQQMATKSLQKLDNVVLLLGGDLLEGEDIYEGQAHKIDDTLEKQITAARNTYFEEISYLKTVANVPIKVVCVSGNHADLGTSSGANADDIIYSMLEDMVNLSDLENVKFVRSDRSDYTTFNYRNHVGYLTHGENRKEHIGTASGKRDWLGIKDEFGFDAAWRGHYHMQKRETVNGAPVFMTNSRKPGDDYTDTITAFGGAGNSIYFATDEEAVEEVRTETVTYK